MLLELQFLESNIPYAEEDNTTANAQDLSVSFKHMHRVFFKKLVVLRSRK
jgi:hypothetical protein